MAKYVDIDQLPGWNSGFPHKDDHEPGMMEKRLGPIEEFVPRKDGRKPPTSYYEHKRGPQNR